MTVRLLYIEQIYRIVDSSFVQTQHFERCFQSATQKIGRQWERWQRKYDKENWKKRIYLLRMICGPWFDIESTLKTISALLMRRFTCECDFQAYFPSSTRLQTALFSAMVDCSPARYRHRRTTVHHLLQALCAIRFAICPMNGNKCKRLQYGNDENINSSDVSLLRLIWFHWELNAIRHVFNRFGLFIFHTFDFPIESIVCVHKYLCGLWTTIGDRQRRRRSQNAIRIKPHFLQIIINKCASFRG